MHEHNVSCCHSTTEFVCVNTTYPVAIQLYVQSFFIVHNMPISHTDDNFKRNYFSEEVIKSRPFVLFRFASSSREESAFLDNRLFPSQVAAIKDSPLAQ